MDVIIETDRGEQVRFAVGLLVVSVALVLGAGAVIRYAGGFLGFLAALVCAAAGLGVLTGAFALSQARHRARVVIDASGVRRERGSTVSWAIAWTELASAGTVDAGGGRRRLVLEPRDADVVRRHPRVGGLRRRGATRAWEVDLRRADPVAVDAALSRWGPQAQAEVVPDPIPPHQVPRPVVPAIPVMIDLAARTRESRVLLRIGVVVTVLFVLGLLATLVAGPESWPLRLGAGGVSLGIVALVGIVWRVRDRRPRWLGIDHEGIRLVNHKRRDLVRIAWGDLAGVGLMTNENARRRRLMSASLDTAAWLNRRMVSVPIWLELFPAGPDAVRRHPELAAAWEAGRPRRPGEQHRWMLPIGDGQGQAFPVGEHVQGWRPDLWRGHRAGSFLFG